MSTHSPSSPKNSALAPDLPLPLQPDPDLRRSSTNPTDMPSDSNRQSISREPGQIADSVSSETRSMKFPSTHTSKSIDTQDGTLGRQVEQGKRFHSNYANISADTFSSLQLRLPYSLQTPSQPFPVPPTLLRLPMIVRPSIVRY